MIEIIKNSDLLDSKCELVINTVNCCGVSGKGIAKCFKEKFPDNYRAYKKVCLAGDLMPGHLFNYYMGYQSNPTWICNFATKDHWYNPSRFPWIKSGLKDLYKFLDDHDIHSWAIPPIGCGNGGLNWQEVRPLVIETAEQYLAKNPYGKVQIYE